MRSFIVENVYMIHCQAWRKFIISKVKKAQRKRCSLSSYPVSCNADMYRTVRGNSGARTSSYWAMSDTAIWISSIFRDRAMAELILYPISTVMFSEVFHQLLWTNFFQGILPLRLYQGYLHVSQLSLTPDFSNTEFRQLQIPNTQTKYTLGKKVVTPRNGVPFWRLFIFYLLVRSKGRLAGRIYVFLCIACAILFNVYLGKFVMTLILEKLAAWGYFNIIV